MDPQDPPSLLSPFSEHMRFDVVERTDGRAVVERPVGPEHANTRGVVHGGVLSALIDMVCGVAVSYQPSVEGRAVVTVSLTVNYLQPATIGDRLRAVGKRAGSGKRIVACEAAVHDQAGDGRRDDARRRLTVDCRRVLVLFEGAGAPSSSHPGRPDFQALAASGRFFPTRSCSSCPRPTSSHRVPRSLPAI